MENFIIFTALLSAHNSGLKFLTCRWTLLGDSSPKAILTGIYKTVQSVLKALESVFFSVFEISLGFRLDSNGPLVTCDQLVN